MFENTCKLIKISLNISLLETFCRFTFPLDNSENIKHKLLGFEGHKRKSYCALFLAFTTTRKGIALNQCNHYKIE